MYSKLYLNLKDLKYFCGKRDVFDCARIRTRVFRLPVDCSNELSYTLHRRQTSSSPQEDLFISLNGTAFTAVMISI